MRESFPPMQRALAGALRDSGEAFDQQDFEQIVEHWGPVLRGAHLVRSPRRGTAPPRSAKTIRLRRERKRPTENPRSRFLAVQDSKIPAAWEGQARAPRSRPSEISGRPNQNSGV